MSEMSSVNGPAPWKIRGDDSEPHCWSAQAGESRRPSSPLHGGKIVICAPVFSDWDCAATLLEHIDQVVQRHKLVATVLFVDDGSSEGIPDSLPCKLQGLQSVEILKLRRNVGHQRAIALGLTFIYRHRPCDAVIVMDADGEDSPDDFLGLLERFESHQGRRIVFAQRARRSENLTFRLFYRLYKIVHRLLTGRTVEVGNFSIIPAARLDCLVGISDLWNHYAASVFKSRMPVDKVPIPRARRLRGESKMNFVSLVTHGLSAISVFGEQVNTRLLVATCFTGVLGVLGVAAVIGIRFGTNLAVPGWATYAAGALGGAVFNALLLSLMFSMSMLQARNNLSFLPLRDYEYYISEVREVATGAAVFPDPAMHRAA